MNGNPSNTLPKQERLHGKKGIEKLLADGRHGSVGHIRYRYLSDNGENHCRILVSVPKKLFKRAVRRNLLKRRIRESWRKLKHLVMSDKGMDIMFIYSTKEVLTYQEIYSHVEKIVEKLNSRIIQQNPSEHETNAQ